MTHGGADVLTLCYHAVSPTWPAVLAVRPETLAAQLRDVVRRGYVGATLTEALERPPARRVVVVTFDDGFRSVLEPARPVLAEVGLPGTVFAVTAFPGSSRPLSWPGVSHWLTTPHAGELTSLSWPELRELADAGWEVGSHTHTHPHLTQTDDETLAGELAGSRAICERELGRPCRTLAYPYGDADGRVVRAAEQAGYAAAAAMPGRFGRPRALIWPRVGVYRRDGLGRFRLKTWPAARLARDTRLVRRLRRKP